MFLSVMGCPSIVDTGSGTVENGDRVLTEKADAAHLFICVKDGQKGV
jgi:hypothetical protein